MDEERLFEVRVIFKRALPQEEPKMYLVQKQRGKRW